MSIQSMLGTPITRLRAPLVTSGYGNQARNWAAATSATFNVKWGPGLGPAGRGGYETVGDLPETSTMAHVFGGPDLDLAATDRVVGPDGNTYEVFGDVMKSFHPRTGVLHHVRAHLQRIAITV